ncbi:MAG: hypothetical protein ACYSUG_07225 [Planctomycetota bacterium]|jgi:hypothetical protein
MKKITFFSTLLILSGFFCGCSSAVGTAISRYHVVAPQIQLGMDKEDVLRALEPTQEGLTLRQTRGPEQYTQDNVHVVIYFFRSHANYDKILTDDEFTPYIFHDGKLAAIGWTAIGGPKTQAQPIPEQHITIIR